MYRVALKGANPASGHLPGGLLHLSGRAAGIETNLILTSFIGVSLRTDQQRYYYK